MNRPLATGIGLALTSCLATAFAQEITVAELKSKGALVLSSDELKTFLPGKIARYDVPGYHYMVKLERDGSLTGSHMKSHGGRRLKQFIGDWKLSDEGRWCMTHQMYNSHILRPTICRDERKAWPVKFSRY